jgi:SAM-dependent methyltransferase
MPTDPQRADAYAPNAGFWVKIIREDLDPYRTGLTNAAVLAGAGDVTGLTVLDGGCAEGYLGRELARRGAKAVGIDTCAPLIEAARETAAEESLSIDYHVGDLAQIPVDDEVFDLAVLNHVVQDIEDLQPVFRELGRVLKPAGRIIIMMLHPCFYSARAEREPAHAPLPPAAYFSLRAIQQPFVVAGITSPAPVTVWVRPLEAYTSLLCGNGFVITGLSEPHPTAEQFAADPWWGDHFVRPLFLLITAEKAARPAPSEADDPS